MSDFFQGLGEFFDAVSSPTTALVRYALIAGMIASVTFGIVGGFVVTRRISYIAAAISHSILGGIGASIYLSRSYDWAWCTPLVGSIVAALASALVIGYVSLVAREREDTIIGAIWSTGMAAGVLFIFFAPGPAVNAESFIFGNILLTSRTDLVVTAVLGAIVVGVTALYYHKLVAVCFDEEFVRLRGVAASAYYLLLLCLIALSVVLLVRLTGMILAIALLVLPAATAVQYSRRLWMIMLLAGCLCLVFTTGGLAFSYPTQTPTGPVVVLFAALTYGVSLLVRGKGTR
jgi:zinc transport system permease protein